jgi:ubiquitin thioesterase OTU1
MSPSSYIATITKPSTWGGAIELGILANHYRTEIASIDVETGRVDHFTPPDANNGGMRCVIVYSGIHYDAATVAPMLGAPSDWHQTVFPVVRVSRRE